MLEERGAARRGVGHRRPDPRDRRLRGAAGHAGTVPMELRGDPLCAAAELVLEAEARPRSTPDLVATVGELQALPGAANVIPGEARMSLDVRHPEDSARAAAVARLRERGAEIAAARGVRSAGSNCSEGAVHCDPALTARSCAAAGAAGADRPHSRAVPGTTPR